MRVRCTGKDAWVTTGREYIVLGVYGRGASFKYRLIGNDGQTPALHDAELFELTSSQIPRDWIFRAYPNSEWEITPAAWATEGFWVAYFDGDGGAKSIFTQVVSALEEQGQKN